MGFRFWDFVKLKYMRNFRDLEVWQSSVLFVKKIYTITDSFPKEEKFGLVSQINRSAVSIP